MPVEMPRRATPIFVLGLQRSGTTWLANMLEAHPEVTAISAARHQGVHESIFFSHFASSYGPLGEDANFRRFLADFTACDYFKLSGVDRGWFIVRCPRDYPGAFRLLMDAASEREGTRYWLEKSPHHTLLCDDLARDFPDARFLAITRDVTTLTASRLNAYGRVPRRSGRRWPALCRAGLANAFYGRIIERFCAANAERCLAVSFEALRADRAREIARIAAFLGVDGRPELFQPRYPANSSFTGPRRADAEITPSERALLRALDRLFRLLPDMALAGLHRARTARRTVAWPAWCWTMEDRPTARGIDMA